MKILRVFPRRTKATPDDKLVAFGPPGIFIPEVDEIHVSVTFTYDLKKAENLVKSWKYVAPVKIGGPGAGTPPGDFVPGMYLKKGWVITSRGCPNVCPHCFVPKVEGTLRELPITEGHILQDNNLLACSDNHIKSVLAMLKKQTEPVKLTGGMEAAKLKEWHAKALFDLRPHSIYFAYDLPKELEPLREAGKTMHAAGFAQLTKSHCLRSYVLCGYKGDTFVKAEKRMLDTIDAGFMPFAMLYRDKEGKTNLSWKKFQQFWDNPMFIHHIINKSHKKLEKGLFK